MKKTIKNIPFAVIIALGVLAQINDYSLEEIRIYAAIAGAVLLANLILAIIKKAGDYFLYGVTGVGLPGILCLLIIEPIGEFYIHHIITGLYMGLFIVAFFPPLFKAKPFTFAYSAGSYPEAITKSRQFLTINLIINYIWAALFVIAMVLTNITYSSSETVQTILSIALPIAVLLAGGIPANNKLPDVLTKIIKAPKNETMNFSSIKELFEAMPIGFNKDNAQGVDAVIQFKLTGDEPTVGYFTIKDGKCSYTEGEHQKPDTTIMSDSKLWLDISNGKVSGDSAFMKEEYQAEGDMELLMRFDSFFADEEPGEDDEAGKPSPESYKFEYLKLEPGAVKKIVVFDGGPRDDGCSKTAFFAKKFCEGAESAGAEVEYIRLKDKEIKPCIGCFNCWTKTPGECIYKDDMGELRKKYREADFIVFASPLYIFTVTGILKNFMDRQIPNLKPYLVTGEKGSTMHPDRYERPNKQGFAVFSAAGFPEVDGNYDGMKAFFRMLDAHSENLYMMGEFYIPGSETLPQPPYQTRKKEIAEACFAAGAQVVKEGRIDKSHMQAAAKTGVPMKTFLRQSNNFWELLEGKKPYLKGIPKM
jgi:multimeric flavodoxin WrbA/putative sterol carrier protein